MVFLHDVAIQLLEAVLTERDRPLLLRRQPIGGNKMNWTAMFLAEGKEVGSFYFLNTCHSSPRMAIVGFSQCKSYESMSSCIK